jgi:hypothetical protein
VVAIRIATLASKSDFVFPNGLHQEAAISTLNCSRPSLAKIVGDPVWEHYRNTSGESNLSIEDFSNIQQVFSIRIQRKFLRWSLNRFDLVTAPSDGLIQLMKKWHVTTPVLLIENGTKCTSELSTAVLYELNFSISTGALEELRNFCAIRSSGRFQNCNLWRGPEKLS